MKKFFAFLALLVLPATVSAYSFGDCSYSGSTGTVIQGLDCPLPPTNLSVTFSGAVQNADPSALSGSYFPAFFVQNGVTYVSFETVVSFLIWFFALFLFCVAFYHLSVVAFKSGRNLFRKPSGHA